jgi:hypothetical protein
MSKSGSHSDVAGVRIALRNYLLTPGNDGTCLLWSGEHLNACAREKEQKTMNKPAWKWDLVFAHTEPNPPSSEKIGC